MFRPENVGGMDRSWVGQAMRRIYLQGMYAAVREEVMQNESRDVFWSNWSEGRCRSFMVFVQEFSDKTAATVKSTALVAYLLHVVLLNCSAVYWRRFF